MNIVLIEPEIPNNTGNIGRLALASGCHLHLVKPFGFEINDARLKRAGLDYWQHISVSYYENIDEFFAAKLKNYMNTLSADENSKSTIFLNYLSDVEIPENAGDFRLLSRRAVDALVSLPERQRYMKGLYAWIGFPQKSVPFVRQPRFAGTATIVARPPM